MSPTECGKRVRAALAARCTKDGPLSAPEFRALAELQGGLLPVELLPMDMPEQFAGSARTFALRMQAQFGRPRSELARIPERNVERIFGYGLLQLLGWRTEELDDVAQQIGLDRNRSDFVVFLASRAELVLEVKAPSVSLARGAVTQAKRYARQLRAGWFGVTNGLQLALYASILPEVPLLHLDLPRSGWQLDDLAIRRLFVFSRECFIHTVLARLWHETYGRML
jgi:hypothetical protein